MAGNQGRNSTNRLGWRAGNISSGVSENNVEFLEITANLDNGDNIIIHNLGVYIIDFTVKKEQLFIETTGEDFTTDRFKINLSGGGPIINATIFLFYKK
jgi:hypothetical protein